MCIRDRASDITDNLEKKGVKIFIGHRGENVDNADLVVYSAAVSQENPEIVRAKSRNIKIATRAELLGVLMDEYESSIAISGTHRCV